MQIHDDVKWTKEKREDFATERRSGHKKHTHLPWKWLRHTKIAHSARADART
jgi:hypothetical protein